MKRNDINSEQFRVLQEFYTLIKAISRRSSKYPFKPVGIPLYETVEKLKELVCEMKLHSDLSFLSTISNHLDKILDTLAEQYELAKVQFMLINQINDLLEVDVLLPSKRLRKRSEKKLSQFIHTIESDICEDLTEWWKDVKKQTRAFLPGLFAYCTQLLLPRTNNEMEQYIKKVKKNIKRLLGREFIHRFFLRRGEYWLFSLEWFEIEKNLVDEDLLDWIRRDEGVISRETQERFDELGYIFKVERRSVLNLEGELERLSEDWKISTMR